jgi:hypothetical protein
MGGWNVKAQIDSSQLQASLLGVDTKLDPIKGSAQHSC